MSDEFTFKDCKFVVTQVPNKECSYFVRYYRLPKILICECGADKCSQPIHSVWCPKAEVHND